MKVEEHVPLIQESRKRKCQSSENASKRQQLLSKLPLRLHTGNENVDLSPLVSAIRKAKRIVVVTGMLLIYGFPSFILTFHLKKKWD